MASSVSQPGGHRISNLKEINDSHANSDYGYYNRSHDRKEQ